MEPETTTTSTNYQSTDDSPSALKVAMGRYRRRGGQDALQGWNEWIDPGRPQEFTHVLRQAELPKTTIDECTSYYKGPLYALLNKPGLYIAPQALSPHLQLSLAHAALTEYCQAPHKTNIDGVPPKPHETINEAHETCWYLWQQQNQQSKKRKQQTPPKYYRSFQKLTWATLGYHYDWTQRKYHPDAYSPVPKVLQHLGSLFAHTAWLAQQQQQSDETTNINNKNNTFSFTASACIVNYYNQKSVMGAHKDDLEYDMTKPIVSLCLGHRSCLFVLGGSTHDDTCIVPIVLRPGDVVVMSGKSRIMYHAMARLLPQSLPAQPTVHDDESDAISWVDADCPLPPESDLASLDAFLQDHRININLRQVYADGQDPQTPTNTGCNNDRDQAAKG